MMRPEYALWSDSCLENASKTNFICSKKRARRWVAAKGYVKVHAGEVDSSLADKVRSVVHFYIL